MSIENSIATLSITYFAKTLKKLYVVNLPFFFFLEWRVIFVLKDTNYYINWLVFTPI